MDYLYSMVLVFAANCRVMDPSLVILTVMASLVIAVVWSWHANKSLDFHLQQCLIDSVTGKIAIEKIGFMSVLALWCWGFVAQTLKGSLSEWYVGLGVGAFVLGRLGSSFLSVKKDIASATGAQQ